MAKKFNYKKYYSEYYGIQIPAGFDIHHIDGDRENNSISNLIMLPSKLHHKYHMTKAFADGFDTKIDLDSCYGYPAQMAAKFFEALQEINEWVVLKKSMDGERVVKEWTNREISKESG